VRAPTPKKEKTKSLRLAAGPKPQGGETVAHLKRWGEEKKTVPSAVQAKPSSDHTEERGFHITTGREGKENLGRGPGAGNRKSLGRVLANKPSGSVRST